MTKSDTVIVTAGSRYLDIDAYACCVAMRELLELKGQRAIAFSKAKCNYSVCDSLKREGQMVSALPPEYLAEASRYIICDVSDPDYIKDGAPLERVAEIYDHHTGFEEYWKSRIGAGAHIEFIGAAATLIYQEWSKAELCGRMTRSTALLLIAAILDNTLNLTSANTAPEDIKAFRELCEKEGVGEEWCASYFSEVQESVEADLHNALFNDLKMMRRHPVLPNCFAQLCVWNARRILDRIDELRRWFDDRGESWMLNLIDIKERRSYFLCEDTQRQQALETIFGIRFKNGIAITQKAYLRKEIIRTADLYNRQIRD